MIKPIVVDSSVTIKWINQTAETYLEQADKLLKDSENGLVTLVAPELSKYEIGNALLKKGLDLARAYKSLTTIYNLPITFISESEDSAKETFKLAQELGITYYDASFLSLAKKHNADLVTDNIKHQGRTETIRVIPLKDY